MVLIITACVLLAALGLAWHFAATKPATSSIKKEQKPSAAFTAALLTPKTKMSNGGSASKQSKVAPTYTPAATPVTKAGSATTPIQELLVPTLGDFPHLAAALEPMTRKALKRIATSECKERAMQFSSNSTSQKSDDKLALLLTAAKRHGNAAMALGDSTKLFSLVPKSIHEALSTREAMSEWSDFVFTAWEDQLSEATFDIGWEQCPLLCEVIHDSATSAKKLAGKCAQYAYKEMGKTKSSSNKKDHAVALLRTAANRAGTHLASAASKEKKQAARFTLSFGELRSLLNKDGELALEALLDGPGGVDAYHEWGMAVRSRVVEETARSVATRDLSLEFAQEEYT